MKRILFLSAALVVIAGCSANNDVAELPENIKFDDPMQEQAASGEQLQVVASFSPLAYLVEQIGGEAVAMTNIVGAQDPHDYSLSPQDVVAFEQADVALLQGAGLEPWAQDIVTQLADKDVTSIVVADILELVEVDGKEVDEEHGYDDHDDHADEHHDEHEGEEGYDDHEEDDHHGHDHGGIDPHTWLDPVLSQQVVTAIVSTLSEIDPENTEFYAINGANLTTSFAALDQAYQDGLGSCARSDVIVSHDAFGYLAERYGFELHPIAGLSTLDVPSAQTLATLKGEAEEGITHILAEENSVKRFAETLASETGLEILPINALAELGAEEDYFEVARQNLASLKVALGCE